MTRRLSAPSADPTIALIQKQGRASEVARALGIKRQAVSQWTKVPWNRVLVVARLMKRPEWLIRPDIYPPPRNQKSSAA